VAGSTSSLRLSSDAEPGAIRRHVSTKKAGTVPLSVELDQNPICGCGEGKDLGGFLLMPRWKKVVPYVTRAAFSPLFAVSYLETVGGKMKKIPDFGAESRNGGGATCAHCEKAAGRGQNLLKCSRCKITAYCGKDCQHADWKLHKIHCRA